VADSVQPFLAALADLSEWLDAASIPAMVVGGVAASILGRPRATRDVDVVAMAPEEGWEALLASAKDYGIAPRTDNPLSFARRTHVLLLRHIRSAVDIDVILGRLPFEAEAVSRAHVHDLGGVQLRLPQVEDLVIMKAVARRPQDLRDIEGLLDAHPDVNVDSVRRWLGEFAVAVSMPDLVTEFDKLVDQRKPR
jgi:hypothetical protein